MNLTDSALLNSYSVYALYSAMAVYALAFIAFAVDLARRSSAVDAIEATDLLEADAASPARAGGTLTLKRPVLSRISARMDNDAALPYGRSSSLRIGVSLTVLAWVLHLAATVMRGFAADRVPWANMYEFAMTGTLLIMTVFLLVLLRSDLRFLGTFVTGLVLVLLGIAALQFYVEVAPLPPALQSAWLVIHVFVASLGTGLFALGFALSTVQLLQARRENHVADGAEAPRGAIASALRLRFLATLPSSATLENLSYRINIIGFILWTFTLMAGSIWAEQAWGRYWGWDTKEVWTFIIWVIYAGYIHARATRGWRGSRSAWLAIIGFSAVMFNFGIVNVFFNGLHSYSGLAL